MSSLCLFKKILHILHCQYATPNSFEDYHNEPNHSTVALCWLGLEWTSSHQCTNLGWGCSSPFGDEAKTHPLPLPMDFSTPFSTAKFSLCTYFPHPSYFVHLIFHSLHLQSSGKLLSLSSTKLWGDVRHKTLGRWRAQCWRNVERRKQEECFIPNAKAREKK